jgi:hypothetical protein
MVIRGLFYQLKLHILSVLTFRFLICYFHALARSSRLVGVQYLSAFLHLLLHMQNKVMSFIVICLYIINNTLLVQHTACSVSSLYLIHETTADCVLVVFLIPPDEYMDISVETHHVLGIFKNIYG